MLITHPNKRPSPSPLMAINPRLKKSTERKDKVQYHDGSSTHRAPLTHTSFLKTKLGENNIYIYVYIDTHLTNNNLYHKCFSSSSGSCSMRCGDLVTQKHRAPRACCLSRLVRCSFLFATSGLAALESGPFSTIHSAFLCTCGCHPEYRTTLNPSEPQNRLSGFCCASGLMAVVQTSRDLRVEKLRIQALGLRAVSCQFSIQG